MSQSRLRYLPRVSLLVGLTLGACMGRSGFLECEVDDDCLAGWRCDDAHCVRICDSETPCPGGLCDADHCVCDVTGCPEACELDGDCVTGVCFDNACWSMTDSCPATLQNACGGCADLGSALGVSCGTCGVTACDGLDAVTCTEAPQNACGGCDLLSAEPGDACGGCGTYVCDGAEAVVCQSPSLNACGGCDTLAAPLGSFCGSCGSYVCDGTDAVLCDDWPANACGGCDNVLDNSDFEAALLCQDRTVDGWTVFDSPGWLWHSGTPKTGDDDACGTGSTWGCLNRLSPLGGGTCLLVWGQGTCPVGEWVELRQTYQAPANITGVSVQYAVSTRHQWNYDWKYEVFYEIAGARTLVDAVIDVNVGPLSFDSGLLVPAEAGSEVTVILRVEKMGPQEGHGWMTLDNFVVDLCW